MKRESTWNDCINTDSSIQITPDIAKARSLTDTALGRNRYLRGNSINENSANYIFEGYYSSVLEMLHAVVLLRGYKVSNHICLGYYLRDIMKRTDLFRLFDDCRFKRNSLIYYGRKMDFAVAKDAIAKCRKLITELKKLLEEEMQ